MIERFCLGHWRSVRTCPQPHCLPIGNRQRRGFAEFIDLDDGEGWAEVVGGTVHMDSNGGAGAN